MGNFGAGNNSARCSFVIVVVLGSLYALRTRANVATETANIQTIITSAQSLLKVAMDIHLPAVPK